MQVQGQKKKRTKGGRYSTEITKEEIEQYFHLPCEEASRHLGIGLTILKRICRRLGIEKWPYRALKRAAKMGDAGNGAAAAVATSGGSKKSGCSPATSSPIHAAAVLNGQHLSRVRGAQPAFQWDGPEVPSATSNGDTGDSWQAQRGKPASPAQPTAAQRLLAGSGGSGGKPPSPLARQGSEPMSPGVPAHKKASPPLPRHQAGASRRRGSLDRPRGGERSRSAAVATPSGASRRSLDLGVLARGSSRTLSPSPESSGDGISAGASGLQRAPSGGLKRIRENDVLLGALGQASQPADMPLNPFALASAGPEDDWQPSSIGGGAEDAATDQLAAGLSRLEMRTLSLKRQCSRDDTALDALDQALLMERLASNDLTRPPLQHGITRALSMPSAASQRRSPPIPHFGTKQAAPNAAPQGGWLAQEQMRLLPGASLAQFAPLPQARPQFAPLPQARPQFAPLPQTRPQVRAEVATVAANQLDGLAGPLDSDPPLLSDPSLAAMLFGMPLPSPKASISDVATDSCLLPDLSFSGQLLKRANSSCMLLDCGEPFGSLHLASARLLRGASSIESLDQAAAAALAAQQQPPPQQPKPGGPPAKDTPAITAVGLTGVAGAGSAVEPGPPARPFGSSGNLLSPFGSVDDHEVEDLLAEFLSPGHGDAADQLLGELLLPLSPTGARTGSVDDALAGLPTPKMAAPQPPSTGPGAQAQAQLPGNNAAAAAPTQSQPAAFGGGTAAHPDATLLGELQSAGSLLSGGGMGSGSIQSHDTQTSAGPTALPESMDLPLSASNSTLQLVAKLLSDPDILKHAFAAELLQRVQARQAAPPAAPVATQPQQLMADWAQLEAQLSAHLSPTGAPSGSQAKPSLAALAQELQQAVQQHRDAQQRYLMHRDQVRTMLLQRQLGPSGSAERAAQLARLKALKLQLAAAQQHQNELRVAYEVQLQLQQHQQQQQQQQAPLMGQPALHAAAPPLSMPQMLGERGPSGMLAFDGSAVRLMPPSLPASAGLSNFGASSSMPLISQLGAQQQAVSLGTAGGQPVQPQLPAYAHQPLLQELLAQQELASNSSMASLLHKWTAEPKSGPLPSAQAPVQLSSAWPASAAAANWGTLQPRLAMQQVVPAQLPMVQRAASAPAPLPFDLDWSSMLP